MNMITEQEVERILGSVIYNYFKENMGGKTVPIVNDDNEYVYTHDVIDFLNWYFSFISSNLRNEIIRNVEDNSIKLKEGYYE